MQKAKGKGRENASFFDTVTVSKVRFSFFRSRKKLPRVFTQGR
jgi:hypothetical protein